MALDGKVVLVAGVGGGLGSAVVSVLASDGATVVAVARSSHALAPLETHARMRGWKVATRTADIFDPAQVERLVDGVVREFGQIDAVSVNVGHWIPGETLLHRLSEQEWSLGLRENLDPVYRIGKAVLPRFIERGAGTMVVVSAAPAVRLAASASYCAAKGGLAELVPKLAHDYRASGVRINAVLPGSMSNHLDSLDPPTPGRPIPLTDRAETSPWEVASAIRYLISDESRWVTGSLLTVDGGATSGGAEPRPAAAEPVDA
jgi:meso-butanediol dehydrogenase / (S,S)-butanediol dehydrogenase / diacetyl reductase